MSKHLSFFDDADEWANPWTFIGDVKLGLVVQATGFGTGFEQRRFLIDTFGHIVGFSCNSQKELLIEVKWDDGSTSPIHPSNVKLFR